MDKRSGRRDSGQVSDVAREVERLLVQNKSIKKALKSMKRTVQWMNEVNEGSTTRTIIGPKIKRPFQRPLPGNTCNFCHKPGHFKRDCWMAKGLCLRCGSGRHMIRNCPHRKVGCVGPARPVRPAPAFPTPPPRRNPEPVPPQQNDQQQRGVEIGADQSRAEASGSAAERVDQCSDPKP